MESTDHEKRCFAASSLQVRCPRALPVPVPVFLPAFHACAWWDSVGSSCPNSRCFIPTPVVSTARCVLPFTPCQTNCWDPVFCRLFPELVDLHRSQQASAAVGGATAAAAAAAAPSGDDASSASTAGASAATAAAAVTGAPGAHGARDTDVGVPGAAADAAAGGAPQQPPTSLSQILLGLAFLAVILAAVYRHWQAGHGDANLL